jgi:hypothetical protein
MLSCADGTFPLFGENVETCVYDVEMLRQGDIQINI